jgi:hypothetical protein
MDNGATKNDLDHLRTEFLLTMENRLLTLENKLTLRFGSMLAAAVAILGGLMIIIK